MGLWGWVSGAIFTVNFEVWIAQELCITILLHFGLVTLRFHFPQIEKVIILMTFELGGRVHDS